MKLQGKERGRHEGREEKVEGGNRIGIREDSKTFWAVGEKQRIHDKKNGGRQGQREVGRKTRKKGGRDRTTGD